MAKDYSFLQRLGAGLTAAGGGSAADQYKSYDARAEREFDEWEAKKKLKQGDQQMFLDFMADMGDYVDDPKEAFQLWQDSMSMVDSEDDLGSMDDKAIADLFGTDEVKDVTAKGAAAAPGGAPLEYTPPAAPPAPGPRNLMGRTQDRLLDFEKQKMSMGRKGLEFLGKPNRFGRMAQGAGEMLNPKTAGDWYKNKFLNWMQQRGR